MKLNWGMSIAIFYLLFMVIMISMVVKASNNRVELVQEDYYNKDLNYEAFRKSRQNATALEASVIIKVDRKSDELQINFPAQETAITGEVVLYRPSNDRLDKKIFLNLDSNNHMAIPTGRLAKGLWKVQLTWHREDQNYYQEQTISL